MGYTYLFGSLVELSRHRWVGYFTDPVVTGGDYSVAPCLGAIGAVEVGAVVFLTLWGGRLFCAFVCRSVTKSGLQEGDLVTPQLKLPLSLQVLEEAGDRFPTDVQVVCYLLMSSLDRMILVDGRSFGNVIQQPLV